jgi:hypothetical protein
VLRDSRLAGMGTARTAPTRGGVRASRFVGSAHSHTDTFPNIDTHDHFDATAYRYPHGYPNTHSDTDLHTTGTSRGGGDPSRALAFPAS